MNLKNQLIDFASLHNLNRLIEFHNYVRGLFKNQLHDLEKCENKDIEYKERIDTLYDYDRNLQINTFLMMYSYLEEWLFQSRNAYAPNVKLVPREGSIGRFKNVVKELGVDLSSKHWQTLKDAEVIRNCLLHANGHINLFLDPQKVRKIIGKKDSNLLIVKDHVVISGEYLQLINANISDMMNTINKSQN